jgi:hypothetical protein
MIRDIPAMGAARIAFSMSGAKTSEVSRVMKSTLVPANS